MTEEILPNLHRIEIPLPESALKTLNSYLVRADGHFLLIDTGLNREECRNAMTSSLDELGVDLSKTDFFITHMPADHMGLMASLATEASTVYFNDEEAHIINMIHARPPAHCEKPQRENQGITGAPQGQVTGDSFCSWQRAENGLSDCSSRNLEY